MKHGTHDWEWQGINFLQSPMAFEDGLVIRLVVDIFAEYSDEQLDQMFAVMALTPQHKYQVLTESAERMLKYFNPATRTSPLTRFARLDNLIAHQYGNRLATWPLPNVMLGVTVQDQRTANNRIPLLMQTPAAVRVLKCGPLLGEIYLTQLTQGRELRDCLSGMYSPNQYFCESGPKVDWATVSGDVGPKACPCDIAHLRSLVRQCKAADVPVFVESIGSNPVAIVTGEVGKKALSYPVTGNGDDPSEWPQDLRVRQLPKMLAGVEA